MATPNDTVRQLDNLPGPQDGRDANGVRKLENMNGPSATEAIDARNAVASQKGPTYQGSGVQENQPKKKRAR